MNQSQRNALSFIALACIDEFDEIKASKKSKKAKLTRSEIMEVLHSKRVKLHSIGADMQWLKYEIGIQQGTLNNPQEDPADSKDTGDGWFIIDEGDLPKDYIKKMEVNND